MDLKPGFGGMAQPPRRCEANGTVASSDPAANGGGSNGPSLTGGGATIKNIEGENLRRFRAVLEGDGGALASVVRRMLGTFMLQRTTEGALRVDANGDVHEDIAATAAIHGRLNPGTEFPYAVP